MRDENDAKVEARFAAMLRTNPDFAKSYFDKGTHAGHTNPEERARHERHVTAVEHGRNLLMREEATAKAPTAAPLTVDTRAQKEIEIKTLMREPAYLDLRHRDHKASVDRVAGLFHQLNTE